MEGEGRGMKREKRRGRSKDELGKLFRLLSE